MRKDIKDNLKIIGELLLKMTVSWVIDSLALWGAINTFLIAFEFSVEFKFIQAFSIIVMLYVLSSIFFGFRVKGDNK